MNIEKIQEQLFEATKSQNQVIFQETLSLSKLKNTWIAQLVTISGTILGSASLFSKEKNFITFIGLIILFLTIVAGLLLIIKNLTEESNRLTKYFANFNDYNLRLMMLTELEIKGEKLTNEEIIQKNEISKEIQRIANNWDILDENGKPKMLSEELMIEKINIGNYILIIGLAIGGIMINMAGLLDIF